MVWSSRSEQVVAGIISGLTPGQRDPAQNHSTRLGALHIGGEHAGGLYLRPSGEVVVVGEDYDHPDVDTVHTDRSHVLRALVWGARRYPELRKLIPVRPPGAVDCRCRQIPIFAEGKALCPECGVPGWLPSDAGHGAAADPVPGSGCESEARGHCDWSFGRINSRRQASVSERASQSAVTRLCQHPNGCLTGVLFAVMPAGTARCVNRWEYSETGQLASCGACPKRVGPINVRPPEVRAYGDLGA